MNIEKKTLRNIFTGVLICIVAYWILNEPERVATALNFIKDIIFPFVLGASLAFIFNVPMRAIERRLGRISNCKLRRIVALSLTFLGLLLVLTLVYVLLVPQLIVTFKSLIPKLYIFAENMGNKVNNFLSRNPEALAWLKENGVETLNIAEITKSAIGVITGSVSSIVSGMFAALGRITNGIVDTIIAIVFAIYCLCQKETLARQGRKLLYAFISEKRADNVVRILRLTNATFSNFLSGQCVEVCILGCLFAISMAIFRMPYIPLVSVLVAVTAFVPVVGAFVGCALGAFFIFIANPIQALWFIVMFLVIQQIENNVIYPRVVGTSIGLSGMWVLVAVAFGGELMGAAGMFLMIPVFSVLYTLAQELTRKRLVKRGIDPEKLKEQPPILSTPKLKWKLPSKKKKTETKP